MPLVRRLMFALPHLGQARFAVAQGVESLSSVEPSFQAAPTPKVAPHLLQVWASIGSSVPQFGHGAACADSEIVFEGIVGCVIVILQCGPPLRPHKL